MSAQQAEKHGRFLLKPKLGGLSQDLFKEAVRHALSLLSGNRVIVPLGYLSLAHWS
jgi:hypothetical protein